MRFKCTMTQGAHWGIFFNKGEWYTPTKIYQKEIKVITDYDKWNKFITTFLEEVQPYRHLKDEETRLKMVAVNEKYKVNPYLKLISLQWCDIMGMDKQIHSYCIEDKQRIKEIHGSSKFETTVYFIEEFFQSLDDYRAEQISTLI